jgi:hemerythrin
MSFFDWTPDLNLGIKVIDDQHRRIADYINDLHRAIEANDKQEILAVADRVVNYTYEHFDYEETLLKKANYLLVEPHIQVHRRFKESAEKMKADIISSSDLGAARKMRSDLMLWLTNHIKKEDADYTESVGHIMKKKSFLSGVFNFFGKK